MKEYVSSKSGVIFTKTELESFLRDKITKYWIKSLVVAAVIDKSVKHERSEPLKVVHTFYYKNIGDVIGDLEHLL